MKRLLLTATLAASFMVSPSADAVTRDEAIVRAKAFAFHPWRMTTSNKTASCKSGYSSVYNPGDYMGLPYDWGGYMTLFAFDQQIAGGYGAGSYPEDGVLSCTSGVDCSGFVSKCWEAGHWTTSSVHQTSASLSMQNMLGGDIFNDAGVHMAMYSHTLGSGEPVMYQSAGYNVHLHMPGWSWTNGYTPRRYDSITGTTLSNPQGTTTNPIKITSFPYTDQRNTTQAVSDVLDGCGLAPNTKETGHEYIYEVTFSQPGTVTVAVQDDQGVDIDVHLYTSMNTSDCVARNDASFSQQVDCGTYYIVADTFKGSTEYPGAYSLNVSFTASNNACGNGPPSYNFNGEMGDDCAYPGNQSLPFCNPNLGSTTCIYTSSDSFCSKACATDNDCGALPGGCCADIGSSELYCLPQDMCGGVPPDVETEDGPDPQGDPENGDGGSPATGGSGGAGAGNGNGNGDDGWEASWVDDDDSSANSGCSASGVGERTSLSGLSWAVLATMLIGFGAARRRRRSLA